MIFNIDERPVSDFTVISFIKKKELFFKLRITHMEKRKIENITAILNTVKILANSR